MKILSLAAAAALGLPSPAHAQTTAEEVIARQRDLVRAALGHGCAQSSQPHEIVVCGERRTRSYRLPSGFTKDRQSREQPDALALNPLPCPQARQRPASAKLDLVAVAATLAAIGAKAAGLTDGGLISVRSPNRANCV